jgi:hypothetical protein
MIVRPLSALALAAVFVGGCAVSDVGKPTDQVLAVVPASAQTSAATDVVAWQVRTSATAEVELWGVDKEGVVSAEIAVDRETADENSPLRFAMSLPDEGYARLAPDGTLLENTLPTSGSAMIILGAVSQDMNAYERTMVRPYTHLSNTRDCNSAKAWLAYYAIAATAACAAGPFTAFIGCGIALAAVAAQAYGVKIACHY